MSVREEIIEAIARNLFVQAYADFCEREYVDGNDTSDLDTAGSGEDWYDHSPDTTDAARDAAKSAVTRIEEMNARIDTDETDLEALYKRACKACVAGRCRKGGEHTPTDFGSDLGMMLTGTGVSWFDDHAHFDLRLPLIEFHIWDRSDFQTAED